MLEDLNRFSPEKRKTYLMIATFFNNGNEIGNEETNFTIEPPPPNDQGELLSSADPNITYLFVGLTGVIAMLIIVSAGLKGPEKYGDSWNIKYLSRMTRAIAMVVVIQAVLILSMVSGGIGEQGTVSILSAIVGYMLGRDSSKGSDE